MRAMHPTVMWRVVEFAFLKVGATPVSITVIICVPLFPALLAEPDIQKGDYTIHWLEKWLAEHGG